MSEDIKSSAHVWNGRSASDTDFPPAYTGAVHDDDDDAEAGPSSRVQHQVQQQARFQPQYDPLEALTELSNISYQKYNVADSTLSKDRIIVTVKHSSLYSQPERLLPFVLEQGQLPPKPMLKIVGRRDRGIDFDINLNLTHLLNLQAPRWSLKSAQVSPLENASRTFYQQNDLSVQNRVASVVKQFCIDRSENKSFTLTRTIEGIPTEMLAGQIRNLAAAVKYRGALQIDFRNERSSVVVHQKTSGWLSSVLRLHPEQKYEAVESVWTFGTDSRPDGALRVGHEWLGSWAVTIRNAMIRRHKGNIGIDDWIEAKMGHTEQVPELEWGRDSASYS